MNDIIVSSIIEWMTSIFFFVSFINDLHEWLNEWMYEWSNESFNEKKQQFRQKLCFVFVSRAQL